MNTAAQKTSTLMLTNVTTIDLAYIDQSGRLRGDSVNPIIQVTGELNGAEAVVCDFGSIKKQIKALIDHKELGYDHKLLVPEAYLSHVQDERSFVITDFLTYEAPLNAIRRMVTTDHYSHQTFATELEVFLSKHLPGFYFNVQIDASPNILPWIADTIHGSSGLVRSFAYTHGLPQSTSWGCVNAAHGHASFIQLLVNREYAADQAMVYELFSRLIANVDQTYFANNQYVIDAFDGTLTLGYTHAERGDFRLKLKGQPWTVLKFETTVENLADFIRRLPEAQALRAHGVTGLYVSEGQWKGAVVSLDLEN